MTEIDTTEPIDAPNAPRPRRARPSPQQEHEPEPRILALTLVRAMPLPGLGPVESLTLGSAGVVALEPATLGAIAGVGAVVRRGGIVTRVFVPGAGISSLTVE
jgi:hypothetical protein